MQKYSIMNTSCEKCNEPYICGHDIFKIVHSLKYLDSRNTNRFIRNEISNYLLTSINNYLFTNIFTLSSIHLYSLLMNNIELTIFNINKPPTLNKQNNIYLLNLKELINNNFINFNKFIYSLIKTINIDLIIEKINNLISESNLFSDNIIGKKGILNKPHNFIPKTRSSVRLLRTTSNYGDNRVDHFESQKYTFYIIQEMYMYYNLRNNLFVKLKGYYENNVRVFLIIKKLRNYDKFFNKYLIGNIASYLVDLDYENYVKLNYY